MSAEWRCILLRLCEMFCKGLLDVTWFIASVSSNISFFLLFLPVCWQHWDIDATHNEGEGQYVISAVVVFHS